MQRTLIFSDGSRKLNDLARDISQEENYYMILITNIVGFVDTTQSTTSQSHNFNKSQVTPTAAAPKDLVFREVIAPDTFSTVKTKGNTDGLTFQFFAPQVYVEDALVDIVVFRQ